MLPESLRASYNGFTGSIAPASSVLGNQLAQKRGSIRCSYSFARDGGAVGSISLKDADGNAVVLPAKAIIMQATIDVVLAPTSGGSATIALTSGASAGDLLAATAFGSAPWSTIGVKAGIPVGTAATMIKLAADGSVAMVVAVAALTAGKVNVFLDYVLSDNF